MKPSSEDEWTVHALNIHGVFFERWCAALVARQSQWSLRSSNYPVRLPPDPSVPGKESSVDIVARSLRDKLLVTLAIECKKNNAEFVNWVFFRRREAVSASFAQIRQVDPRTGEPSWCVVRGMALPPQHLCDEARETRGDYVNYHKGNITRTANASISDACNQIALGAQAIAWDESQRGEALDDLIKTDKLWANTSRSWSQQVVVPCVFTTAHLKVASFDAADVHAQTGEIPYAAVTFATVPYLVFEYALPRHLQIGDVRLEHLPTDASVDIWSRLYIIVVNSEHIETFFQSSLLRDVIRSNGGGAA